MNESLKTWGQKWLPELLITVDKALKQFCDVNYFYTVEHQNTDEMLIHIQGSGLYIRLIKDPTNQARWRPAWELIGDKDGEPVILAVRGNHWLIAQSLILAIKSYEIDYWIEKQPETHNRAGYGSIIAACSKVD